LSEALVNPHIYSGPSGSPADSGEGKEGVNYLRRLKGEFVEGAPAEADARGYGRAPAATVSGVKERRQELRLRCSGSVEFRVEESGARVWATLTDISLHGCYVEMNSTFPVGTRVKLVLKSFGIRIQVSGSVRATYPSLGMGILFADIEREEELQLRQLLAALAGRRIVSKSAETPANGMQDAARAGEPRLGDRRLGEPRFNEPRSDDPRSALDEIAAFFQKNQALSRDEFYEIAKRVRRP
jgi:PilZ domain